MNCGSFAQTSELQVCKSRYHGTNQTAPFGRTSITAGSNLVQMHIYNAETGILECWHCATLDRLLFLSCGALDPFSLLCTTCPSWDVCCRGLCRRYFYDQHHPHDARLAFLSSTLSNSGTILYIAHGGFSTPVYASQTPSQSSMHQLEKFIAFSSLCRGLWRLSSLNLCWRCRL